MAFGFIPYKSPNPAELETCIHLSGDAVLLGIGDAVKLATGSVNIGDGPTVQAVARAASGDRVYGVVVGFKKQEVTTGFTLDTRHCPASTAMYCLVKPVRTNDKFKVLEDAVGGSVASTDIGKNANMVVANASAVTGLSGTMLDSSSAATTNTLDLCIRGVASDVGNVAGSSAVLVVSFNKVANVDQATGV
jgi:hypothetical protein